MALKSVSPGVYAGVVKTPKIAFSPARFTGLRLPALAFYPPTMAAEAAIKSPMNGAAESSALRAGADPR